MTEKEIDGILAQARAMDMQREAFLRAKLGLGASVAVSSSGSQRAERTGVE